MKSAAHTSTPYRLRLAPLPHSALPGGYGDLHNCLILASNGGPKGRISRLIINPEILFKAPIHNHLAAQSALRRLDEAKKNAQDYLLFVFNSFEFGQRLQDLKPKPFQVMKSVWDDLIILRCDTWLEWDHYQNTLSACALGPEAKDKAKKLADYHKKLCDEEVSKDQAQTISALTPTEPSHIHEAKVKAAIEAIHRGDFYQVNLARAWQGKMSGDNAPFALFKSLLNQSPAPFALYLRLGGTKAIISNSPERFITISNEGRLSTEPIKGTAPRYSDPAMDKLSAENLTQSLKDRAENLMIVDLMRNDCAQIAISGSVAVPKLWALESYQNVHHLVSEVTASLTLPLKLSALFQAFLPTGSISGAPKIAALAHIIKHDEPRGPYCGNFWVIEPDGRIDSNVLIRSLIMEKNSAQDWGIKAFGGGGIVADSTPEQETRECATKMKALEAAYLSITPQTISAS